jgi:hypothetical protein
VVCALLAVTGGRERALTVGGQRRAERRSSACLASCRSRAGRRRGDDRARRRRSRQSNSGARSSRAARRLRSAAAYPAAERGSYRASGCRISTTQREEQPPTRVRVWRQYYSNQDTSSPRRGWRDARVRTRAGLDRACGRPPARRQERVVPTAVRLPSGWPLSCVSVPLLPGGLLLAPGEWARHSCRWRERLKPTTADARAATGRGQPTSHARPVARRRD